jgi:D-psicose/D-tagatose/L-ribulose 3-epimerase
MRISVSNIAWDPPIDMDVAAILRNHDVDAVDIAPGKYFPDVSSATSQDIAAVRSAWAKRGFEITGMQSLLFGTTGLNVFGPEPVRRRMLDYLDHVCRVGGGLGARHLVFGSPRNRNRDGLDDATALTSAVAFFRELGDRARSHGVEITLEPNPTIYSANFMTTSWETADVVRAVAHPAVRMQLDTGSCTVNGEDVVEVVRACADLVGHVHLSEPRLAPVGTDETDHPRASSALAAYLPSHVACIEMVMTTDVPATESVARAVSFVIEHYRRVTP